MHQATDRHREEEGLHWKKYMKQFSLVLLGIACILCVVGGVLYSNRPSPIVLVPSPSSTIPTQPTATSSSVVLQTFVWPISRPQDRTTKKIFGTYVEPGNSVVTPERFKGYHTGLDFETFPDEKDAEVVISAVCAGKVLQARTASGYGGVLVQSCEFESEPITIVYGHLKAKAFSVKVGQLLEVGQRIGVLGKGGSSETDGERKHLHLGIHRGAAVSILGYISTKSRLTDWIDPVKVFAP